MNERKQPATGDSPPVYFIVRDGVISFASSTSIDVSGIAPEQLQGRMALDLVHPDDRARMLAYLAPGWEGVIDDTVRVEDAKGVWHWRRVEGVRTIEADGHASAVLTLTKVEGDDEG